MTLDHMEDMRFSTLLYNVTQHLLYTKWRDPGRRPTTTPVRPVEADHEGVAGDLPGLQGRVPTLGC
jgi:hypothetical protein